MATDAQDIQPKAVTSEEQPAMPLSPGKDTEELLSGIQKGLNGLAELFEITPGITMDDKMKLAGILNQYKELVTENLGVAPGQSVKRAPMKKELDQRPIEAGIADVIQAL